MPRSADWRRWPVPEVLAGVILALVFTRAAKDLPPLGPLSLSFLLHSALAVSLLVWRPVRPIRWTAWAALGVFVVLAVLRQRPMDAMSALLVAAAFSRPSGMTAVRLTLALVAIVLGIHGLVFRALLEPTPYTALQRFSGFTGDPNDLTTVALIATSASLARLFGAATERSVPLSLDALAAAFGAIAVLLSQSRLGMVAFVLLVAVLAARRFQAGRSGATAGSRWSVFRGLAVAIVGLTVLVAAAPSRFWFRMFRLFEGKDLGYRPFLVKTAWSAFCDHPWLGIGVGRFPELARGLAPHSTLLEAMAEGGLFHLAILTIGVGLVVRVALRGPTALTLPALVAVGLALIGPIDLRVMILAVAIVVPHTAERHDHDRG